jgi:hypothetical protein
MKNGLRIPTFGCILAGLALSAVLVRGQAIDGNLVGAVTDSSGAAVPRSQVIATNKNTGLKYSALTDGVGQYRINHLPVGLYDVAADAPDLASQTAGNVNLQLNHTATVNFQLPVATQAASVQVIAAPPPIDAATSQLQVTFDSQALVQVPASAGLSGYLNLSLLGAGVASPGGLGLGVGPSVGGQRPSNNRFNIDGVDQSSYFATGPLTLVSNEAISEFTVLQNQFSSQFGGASGGIFNAVVKSGGNQFHGSLYEYLQNRNLNALDATQVRNGYTSTPRFDSNRLGASMGGPIVKNRLFYFGDFEYNPTGYAVSPAATVFAPTAGGYQTLNNLSGVSKTNLQVLEKYLPASSSAVRSTPVANTPIPIGPLSIVAPSYQNAYRAVGSVDWNLGDRDQVRGRYMYNRQSGLDTSASLPIFFVAAPNNTHLISLSEFHAFSGAAENELRLAYSRNVNRKPAGDFSFPGLDSFPTLTLLDLQLQLGPDANVPNGQIQGELQASDALTRTWGRHTLTAGYEFHDVIMTSSFVSYPRGNYWYSSLGQYLGDLTPDVFGQRTLGTTGPLVGGNAVGFLQNGAFANDDFRVRPNLTLNLGVRYEFVTVPLASRAQSYSAIADVPGVVTFREPQPTKTDWSPRIGFAYSPGKNGVWAIRGGFGRAFDMPYTNIAVNTLPAFYGGLANVNVNSNTPGFLANGGLNTPSGALSSVASARAAISSYSPDQRRPYAINYTLAVQRLLGKDYTLEARYLGSKGVHLYVQEQINRTSPVTAARNLPTFLTMPTAAQLAVLPLTLGALKAISNNPLAPYGFSNAITAYEPIGNSQYHGLALQMTKRYSKSFSYLAAYTWSHLMDDSTATVNTTLLTPRRPQDFQNLRAEWASSMLDRRQRFTFTPIFDFNPFPNGRWIAKNIAGNWNLALTYIYESPEYATVQSNVDANLNGDAIGDRSIINLNGSAGVGSGVTPVDGSGKVVPASSASIVAYVAKNPNARYIAAGKGAYANGGRNTFPLAPIDNIDFSLRKRFAIGEQKRLELGGQFYNLFNHPQFVAGYLNDVAYVQHTTAGFNNFLIPSNGLFGQYRQFLSSNSRYIQIVARLTF